VCGQPLAVLRDSPDAGRAACPTGHFVHYDNPALTTMAFISDGDRYLILRRADEPCRGEWDMPGGFVEAGEDPGECVRREIAEETGLEVEILDIIGAYCSRYGDAGKHTVDIAYHCRRTGGRRACRRRSPRPTGRVERLPATGLCRRACGPGRPEQPRRSGAARVTGRRGP